MLMTLGSNSLFPGERLALISYCMLSDTFSTWFLLSCTFHDFFRVDSSPLMENIFIYMKICDFDIHDVNIIF